MIELPAQPCFLGLFTPEAGASQVELVIKNPPSNARDIRDAGLTPGSGRSPGGGNGTPLQYSYLANPMNRGAWWAAVHWVTKSWTQLSTHASFIQIWDWTGLWKCFQILIPLLAFFFHCITIYVFFKSFNHVTVLHTQKFKFLKSDADESKQKYLSGPNSTSSIKVFLILAVCDFFLFSKTWYIFHIFFYRYLFMYLFFSPITLKFLLTILETPFST